MKRFFAPSWQHVALVLLLSFTLAVPRTTFAAKSAVKLQKWSGTIDSSAEGPVPFTLAGNASHLGKFSAYGEVEFVPGEEEGTLIGEGVAVFTAANGDQLVGTVSWDVANDGEELRTSSLAFHWADSVTFQDGTTFANTGRFIDDRPPGLVVIAIIAVLIGLLLPAVQK